MRLPTKCELDTVASASPIRHGSSLVALGLRHTDSSNNQKRKRFTQEHRRCKISGKRKQYLPHAFVNLTTAPCQVPSNTDGGQQACGYTD